MSILALTRISLTLALAAFGVAWADCQDVCTDTEAQCSDDCSPDPNKGGAGTVICVHKCAAKAKTCSQHCTPDPKPEPEPDSESKKLQINGRNAASRWRSAFPLDLSDGGIDGGACCNGSVSGPMCPYVLCTNQNNAALKRRTWSGKLFDSDLGYKPKGVYEQCGTARAPSLCSILSKVNRDNQLSPSTYDVEMIRRQLEAFRRANDFAKVTRQISPDEHMRFLNAYKQDIRSLRQYGVAPR